MDNIYVIICDNARNQAVQYISLYMCAMYADEVGRTLYRNIIELYVLSNYNVLLFYTEEERIERYEEE